MSAPGGSAPGRMSVPGGVCSRGVSAPRRMSVPQGGSASGGIPACTEADPPCEQNDRQVQKYYLGHNFVAAGNDDRIKSNTPSEK